jgi:Tfp pilus assembly protein PilO
MSRLLLPIIIIGAAIGVFFMLTDPMYNDISSLQTQVSSYNDALTNSKALENERDKLTAKYNAMNPDNLAKIEKFLPGSVDNIRLILEIEQIAAPYGMTLKDVKYNTPDTTPGAASGVNKTPQKSYGAFDLEFSTTGAYGNFVNFTKDLENNLRIVDVTGITFNSSTAPSSISQASPFSQEAYTYDIKIRTYWLKN